MNSKVTTLHSNIQKKKKKLCDDNFRESQLTKKHLLLSDTLLPNQCKPNSKNQ